MNVLYKSLIDILEQVRDNQMHDKDSYDGLSEEEIEQVNQYFISEQSEN